MSRVITALPTEFAQDTERLARFEREAKTLAMLNHPNIAQIYGFEKSTGVHARDGVGGGTDLADRITQGAIPVLSIALGMRKREVVQRPDFSSSASPSDEDLEKSRGLMRRDGRMTFDAGASIFEPLTADQPSSRMMTRLVVRGCHVTYRSPRRKA